MNDHKHAKSVSLYRLTQLLVEDILSTSDAEILDEAKEGGIEPAATAARLKSLYEKAASTTGRSRLAAAKVAVEVDRHNTQESTVALLDPSTAQSRLQSALAQDPETRAKLTLAARKGEGLSNADVHGLLQDFDELGLLPLEDDKGGGA